MWPVKLIVFISFFVRKSVGQNSLASGAQLTNIRDPFLVAFHSESASLNINCHCESNSSPSCAVSDDFWLQWASKVQHLNVRWCRTFNISYRSNLFANLSTINLSSNWLEQLKFDSFSGFHSLIKLNLSNNLFHQLEFDAYAGLNQLEVLDLSHNRLRYFNVGVLSNIAKLRELHLNDNQLHRIVGLHGLINLETANLARNRLETLLFRRSNDKLKWFDLAENSISNIQGYDWHNIYTWSFLNLSHNAIDQLDSHFLFYLRPFGDFVLDLRHNRISRLREFSDSDRVNRSHERIHHQRTLFIDHNPINCDCQVFHFLEYLSSGTSGRWNVDLGSLQCHEPKFLRNVSLSNAPICPCAQQVKSRNLSDHLISCDLRTWEAPLSQIADEELSMNRENVDLSGHQLSSTSLNLNWTVVLGEYLPNLKRLDLSHNAIYDVDQSTIDCWMEFNHFNIALGHNPWNCTCRLIPLYTFLINSPDRVEDVDQINCFGVKLISLHYSDLCPVVWPMIPLVSSVLTLALIFICIFIMQLYYPLWSLRLKFKLTRTEPEDVDRPFDAFISHAHQDEEFVMEQLRPKLEPTYRLLLHQRDWLCGEWIPDQIENSVSRSKRTIIVLTDHFLRSQWAQLEFRTAYEQGLRDKKMRLIIIVLGQLPSQRQMSSQLRRFVSLCTYLKWGDPWFWNRLKFALPKKNNQLQIDLDDPSAVDGHVPPLPLRRINDTVDHVH